MPASAVPPIVAVDPDVPTWKSPNELIHERINFDDTIWGFGLAGGAYYKTPLRITYVKQGSRAEMAHIYPGDVVLRINGIESSTLTLEEAHKIILESGIYLKIAVTSPEDLEDNYFCYQDPLESQIEEIEVKQIKHKAIPKFAKVLGKSSHWSLQWPWKCKRKIIYKESNCYLVPSKYEEKHKDTRKPEVKQDDMIVLDSIHNVKGKNKLAGKSSNKSEKDGSVDKNNAGAPKQNLSEDPKNEEIVTEQITSAEKIPGVLTEAENSSINKNIEDEVAENDRSADEKEDVATEENSFVDKNEEDIDAGQNTSTTTNEGDKVIEHNGSEQSVNKNDNMEEKQNISEEKISNKEPIVSECNVPKSIVAGDIAEENISENRNEEQNSVEVIDSTEKDGTDGDNVKFDDIPLMNDSEKLAHTSR